MKDFCEKIEEYIRSPLLIEAEWTTIQMIVVGFSVAAGAAVTGYIADPGLVLIGLAEATSARLVCAGGATGALTAGATATSLIKERLTDSNYKNVVNFIVQKLFKAQQKSLDAASKAEVTDLLDQENIFSKEKALIRLAPNNMLESFGDCSTSKSTKKSEEEVMKRIKAIQIIHRIREIFSLQCFIGVAGFVRCWENNSY